MSEKIEKLSCRGRLIKFRAWSESENKFLPNEEIARTLMKFHLPEGEAKLQPLIHIALIFGSEGLGWVFQQFTSIFDKNGKEIYEGDILMSHGARFVIKDWPYGLSPCLRPEHPSSYEVIGNIFETPELL